MWNSHKGIGENIKEELTEEQRESISDKGNGVKNIYSGPETSFGSFFFFLIWFLNIILLSILKREILFFLSFETLRSLLIYILA